MTIDGTYAVFVLLAFLILLAAEHCWRWTQQDKRRRNERLRARGLS